jgi:hypothetical protein
MTTKSEDWNMDDTRFSVVEGNSTHEESGLVRRSHIQRRRSANPSILRSGMLRPPTSLGAQTIGQAILQRPPETSSLPAHRKAR